MLDHVSDCERNMRDTAMTDITSTRINVRIKAMPFWFDLFMEKPRFPEFMAPSWCLYSRLLQWGEVAGCDLPLRQRPFAIPRRYFAVKHSTTLWSPFGLAESTWYLKHGAKAVWPGSGGLLVIFDKMRSSDPGSAAVKAATLRVSFP